MVTVGDYVEQIELSDTARRSIFWDNHFRNLLGREMHVDVFQDGPW